ncbi:MAG TPA: hypothetical protein VFU36_08150 [Jatrophihabitans sp.]|nr:hypothetical protein [Jatrophihabitans sp.]
MAPTAEATETVSFRVSAAEKQWLEVIAEYNGEKPSPFVKKTLIRVLSEITKSHGGIDKIIAANLASRRRDEETHATELANLIKSLPMVSDSK